MTIPAHCHIETVTGRKLAVTYEPDPWGGRTFAVVAEVGTFTLTWSPMTVGDLLDETAPMVQVRYGRWTGDEPTFSDFPLPEAPVMNRQTLVRGCLFALDAMHPGGPLGWLVRPRRFHGKLADETDTAPAVANTDAASEAVWGRLAAILYGVVDVWRRQDDYAHVRQAWERLQAARNTAVLADELRKAREARERARLYEAKVTAAAVHWRKIRDGAELPDPRQITVAEAIADTPAAAG